MDKVARVKSNIDAVVEHRTRTADDKLQAVLKELESERSARIETERVLEQATFALSDLRKRQAIMTEMQQELQATVSQMRDDLEERDKELTVLKNGDHKRSLWTQRLTVSSNRPSGTQSKEIEVRQAVLARQEDDLGRKTYDGLKTKLVETETQLAEAVQIIRELTDVVQGNPEIGKSTANRSACPACGYLDGPRGAKQDGDSASESFREGPSGSEAEGRGTPLNALPPPGPSPSGEPGRRDGGGGFSGSGAPPPMFWVTKESSGNPLAKLWGGGQSWKRW